MRRAPLAILMLASMALAGCATLEHGTEDDVPVVTDPPGARVSSSTGTNCTSPCTVSGGRRDTFGITIAKHGFVTQYVAAAPEPDTTAVAAASTLEVTPDVLGRIIDVQDGSHYHHEPRAVVVKLEPDE